MSGRNPLFFVYNDNKVVIFKIVAYISKELLISGNTSDIILSVKKY